ncbi:MAG: hypothetical protein V7767_14525 [Leeuwenhoekiella sp.]
MPLIVSKTLIAKGYTGFACWPFIIARDKNLKNDPIFINHERIHLKQQLELLIIPFYFWYGLEFIVRYFQYKNAYKAYRNISFEREAYTKETSLSYLKIRKNWSFIGFL